MLFEILDEDKINNIEEFVLAEEALDMPLTPNQYAYVKRIVDFNYPERKPFSSLEEDKDYTYDMYKEIPIKVGAVYNQLMQNLKELDTFVGELIETPKNNDDFDMAYYIQRFTKKKLHDIIYEPLKKDYPTLPSDSIEIDVINNISGFFPIYKVYLISKSIHEGVIENESWFWFGCKFGFKNSFKERIWFREEV